MIKFKCLKVPCGETFFVPAKLYFDIVIFCTAKQLGLIVIFHDKMTDRK